MLALITFAALLGTVFLMLPGRTQANLIRLLFPLGLVLISFVLCMALGLLVSFMAHADSNVILTKYITFPLSTQVGNSMNTDPSLLSVGGKAALLIPLLAFEIAFSATKLAFSLKMPFLTFMYVVWVVWVGFISEFIVKPWAEQAKRDRELDPDGTAGEGFTAANILRLYDEGQRDKEREEAEKRAAGAAVVAAFEAKHAKPAPLPPLQPGQARIVTDDADRQFAKRYGR